MNSKDVGIDDAGLMEADLTALRAENARLREALQGCITQLAQDNPSCGTRDYETALPYTLAKARAALGAKP